MTGESTRIRGLYAITPDIADTDRLAEVVSLALKGGTRVVQYRNKSADSACALNQARTLRSLTQQSGATLVINDDAELAVSIGADGVHLGEQDFAQQDEARRIQWIRDLARAAGHHEFIVGVSCYNDLARAERAVAADATYIAFGSVFPSSTKPHARRASTMLISEAKRLFSLPVVAIGGITSENAPQLIAVGVDAIAVVSSLFDAADIQAQAKTFNKLFARHV